MSNKDIDHKQLIVAKCYELALIDCRDDMHKAFLEFSDPPTTMIDDVAMGYLRRITKVADAWNEEDQQSYRVKRAEAIKKRDAAIKERQSASEADVTSKLGLSENR
mgnify:FL=1